MEDDIVMEDGVVGRLSRRVKELEIQNKFMIDSEIKLVQERNELRARLECNSYSEAPRKVQLTPEETADLIPKYAQLDAYADGVRATVEYVKGKILKDLIDKRAR